jgi:hypothetical protein
VINIVFTLVSAIIGVAMFGAVLLASAKSEAATADTAQDAAGSDVAIATPMAQPKTMDGIAIDGFRVANTNVNGDGAEQGRPAQPPRPATDQEPRTQLASKAANPRAQWQMAAQIADLRKPFRQM